MQKFFHKSRSFDSPWSSADHVFSTLILKVIMTTLIFQKNLTLKKKQKRRKATKEVDAALWSNLRSIKLLELWKKQHKYTAGQRVKDYFSLVMGIKMMQNWERQHRLD